ncbi:hypothetical protein APHAL10511_004522 [Amanita phalloides]|nr:hypothetical protein APHAL10511_004522 [Amanita phalloides]
MGVKSLWSLLAPVGRPILLETFEGKAMAIDSSIWIYQFQATMRDKDGRALVNAHVLGFLRRIAKLLFYGIKPVFVFDGGAPALKLNTLNARKRKKSGAATSHIKIAEKLLAARLRKEALDRTQGEPNQGKKKASDEDKIVYLEDVDPTVPKAPPRICAPDRTTSSSTNPAKKKSKFYDHDPYRLPDLDLQAAVSKATSSAAPDPRLATEEELRAFIDEMRPENFDVTSPEFRQLPTEVQYEIVGDLRLKSRQTSHARLEKMLRKSRTPMDFSKAQIQNLQQRNVLTQQLLVTTDSIGKAHISIPVRIASERNKEYVLVKNESEAKGWILGIRDHGTREKPITIDQADGGASSDEDMEEVEAPTSGPMDRDLRQFQSEMALQAIVGRKDSTGLASLKTHKSPAKKSTPLFDLDDDDDDNILVMPPRVDDSEGENEALSFAIQASLDDAHSKAGDDVQGLMATSDTVGLGAADPIRSLGNFESTPSRLRTVLSFANISPSGSKINRRTSMFGPPSPVSNFFSDEADAAAESDAHDDGLDDAYIDIDGDTNPVVARVEPAVTLAERYGHQEDAKLSIMQPRTELNTVIETVTDETIPKSVDSDSDEDMEEVMLEPAITPQVLDENSELGLSVSSDSQQVAPGSQTPLPTSLPAQEEIPPEEEDSESISWSRSHSPEEAVGHEGILSQAADETWDAAQEMDPRAEEGEFARFISQVKGRDIAQVRREIEDEIESLNQQRKAAMRDSEDITQQTIAQIMTMLRLFGIPYITAPMEAEAQCAELVSLGLVDGVITDDSDVFLFGAERVFKNMFNQSKTVECFMLSDLSRELGLERDTLVRLAYLLGSDYVEGLPGIGPVVAMELLKEFPGMDGLHKFRDWWTRVQNGRDTVGDTQSKFRKRFKKKFKNLYLDKDWPTPVVRDAYYHPAVDSSEEPFKWGMPDLDGLRQFFQQELGWEQTRVDELLLPIIQKMNKRGHAAAMNKQSNLTEYFDVSAGMGTYAPRKRQAYTSKRLQDVVADFRKRQRSDSSIPGSKPLEGSRQTETNEDSTDDNNEDTDRKRRKTGRGKRKTRASVGGIKGRKRKSSKKQKKAETEDEDEEESDVGGEDISTPSTVQLRPRPRPTYQGAKSAAGEDDDSS